MYQELFERWVTDLTVTPNRELKGKCPFHDDQNPSWTGSPITGLWHCFGCDAKGNAKQFAKRVGEEWHDPRRKAYNKNPWTESQIVATYDYHDKQGNLIYQSVRFDPKDFRQRRPDGKGGWINNLQGVDRVLYGLHILPDDAPICFVEGEKDADNLRANKYHATTIAGGVNGILTLQMLMPLEKKHIIIFPDNDAPGKEFSKKVAALLAPIVADIRIVDLPVPSKEDISWWFEQGYTPAELDQIIAATSRYGQSWQPVLRPFTAIEERTVPWLWYPYLPIGRLTILEGDPGQGKTWFSLAIATCVSLGSWLEVNAGEENHIEPAGVVYLSCEDDAEDTTKKRLRVLQADQSRIFEFIGKARLSDSNTSDVTLKDLALIRQAIKDTRAKLLIIDPIQGYLPRGTDMNKAEQIRPLLRTLQRVAKEEAISVLIVRHLAKGSKDRALYKGLGSIDFTAAARSVLLCAERKELEEWTAPQDGSKPTLLRRRFAVAQVKNNLTARGLAIEFELQKDSFLWIGMADLTADQLIAPVTMSIGEESATQEAKKFLLSFLHTAGYSVRIIQAEAKKAGIDQAALMRAKSALAIELRQDTDGWSWWLPEKYTTH